jgi:hypothetical protein
MSAKLTIQKQTTGPKLSIEEFFTRLEDKLNEQAEEGEDQGKGKIYRILKAYTAGYAAKTIAKYGKENKAWSPVTVYRQTSEYNKLRHAPATHYQGFEIFEMRVKRVMAAKKMTREQAVDYIYEKDLDEDTKPAAKATEVIEQK